MCWCCQACRCSVAGAVEEVVLRPWTVDLCGGRDASAQHAWCCILFRSRRAAELQYDTSVGGELHRSAVQRVWRSCGAAFMVMRPSHRRRKAELQCSASCCDGWTSPAMGAAVQRTSPVRRSCSTTRRAESGGSCSAADLTGGGSCSAADGYDGGCYDPQELNFTAAAAGRRGCCRERRGTETLGGAWGLIRRPSVGQSDGCQPD